MNDPGIREEPSAPKEVSLFVIGIGRELFAIETGNVREVLERPQLRRVPLAPRHIVGLIPYRGEVLTTVSVRTLLGRDDPKPAGCILVLEDEQTCEHWALSVDVARGVLMVRSDTLHPNSSTLDARRAELFDGAYELPSGRIIRLDPHRLKPEQLSTARLFHEPWQSPHAANRGGHRCAH